MFLPRRSGFGRRHCQRRRSAFAASASVAGYPDPVALGIPGLLAAMRASVDLHAVWPQILWVGERNNGLPARRDSEIDRSRPPRRGPNHRHRARLPMRERCCLRLGKPSDGETCVRLCAGGLPMPSREMRPRLPAPGAWPEGAVVPPRRPRQSGLAVAIATPASARFGAGVPDWASASSAQRSRRTAWACRSDTSVPNLPNVR